MSEWDELEKQCKSCVRCGLHQARKNVVIGRGNPQAPLLLIGEGPGEQEDIQGLPFVGPAGKLLEALLTAIGITEETYYITNIVKCRPPAKQ